MKLLFAVILFPVSASAFEIRYLDAKGNPATIPEGGANLSFGAAGVASDWTCEILRPKNAIDEKGKVVGRGGFACHMRNHEPTVFGKVKCSDGRRVRARHSGDDDRALRSQDT